jgi:hypothetical protein
VKLCLEVRVFKLSSSLGLLQDVRLLFRYLEANSNNLALLGGCLGHGSRPVGVNLDALDVFESTKVSIN